MKYRKLLKDSVWNIFDYISTLAIFLITTKILISEFGTSGYGFYTFFISLVGFFGMVDMGMGMAVSKYLSEFLHEKNYSKSSEIINVSFLFYIVMSLFVVAIVYFFTSQIVAFLDFEQRYYEVGFIVLRLVTLIFVMNLLISIPTNILVALEGWFFISNINVLFKIFSSVLLVYILFMELDETNKFIYIFSMVLCVSLLKLLVLSFSLKFYSFKYFFVFPSLEIRRKVFGFLKFSSFQYFLSLLIGHLDKFIIARLFGLDALGVYNFCLNAFVYLYGFIVNGLKVFYPKLSRLHAEGNLEALKKSGYGLLILTTSISLVASFFLVFLWDFMVTIYIDKEFADASFYIIPFFSLFLVTRSPEVVMHYFFNATANPKMLVKNLIISAPVTFGLYFVMVPLFEVEGLIISQILGGCAVYIWHLYMFKTKGFKLHATKS